MAQPLTDRELQIAMLIAREYNNGEIAAELVISPRTVEAHINSIRRTLRLKNRVAISNWWYSLIGHRSFINSLDK